MIEQELQSWVGREERQRDIADTTRAQRMHALLDHPIEELRDGATLPPGYHWLYAIPITARSEWRVDGHARATSFLPPFSGRRRMWAGGSLQFRQPLLVGDPIERYSVIRSIEEKNGRTGPFTLVRVDHHISRPNGLAILEQQHLVYLPADTPPSSTAPAQLTAVTEWEETFTTDEVTLFYFSALTMNGHRIHYDQPYATESEGYRGLLVHAPLTALLLLDAARRHGAPLREFSYRASAPLFCRETITLTGQNQADGSMKVWALRPDGGIAMAADTSASE